MANLHRKTALALVALLLSSLLALFPAGPVSAVTLANPAFNALYAAGGMGETLWGAPGPALAEPYRNAEGGNRQVQYFDKGRMELTYPTLQPGQVSSGRLVWEMVTGRVQVSDTVYYQYDGAEIPVTGGNTFASNPKAPSYLAFQSLVGARISRTGAQVAEVLPAPEDEGLFLGFYSLNTDFALGSLAKYVRYIPETGHNIPDVFWNYLNQKNADGLPAFNWESLFGLPITDSYWTKVRQGDQPMDVLVQLFERRTLLYNPALPPGEQVYSGNVGSDYYRWRYQMPELPVVNTSFNGPDTSPNASVSPPIGEAGVTFELRASGFQPDEKVEYYARVSPDGGVYSFPSIQADSQGKILRRLRTGVLATSTTELYYNLRGQSSGVTALWHLKIIGSTCYTPAVEAAQSDWVPEGDSAALDRKVLRFGETSRIFAVGFQPGEPLNAWVTTPLSRVVPAFSDFRELVADETGAFQGLMGAPGSVLPGIYAITIHGTKSQKLAIAYFQVRPGPAASFNPYWSGSLDGTGNSVGGNPGTFDPSSLFAQRSQLRQQSFETEAG